MAELTDFSCRFPSSLSIVRYLTSHSRRKRCPSVPAGSSTEFDGNSPRTRASSVVAATSASASFQFQPHQPLPPARLSSFSERFRPFRPRFSFVRRFRRAFLSFRRKFPLAHFEGDSSKKGQYDVDVGSGRVFLLPHSRQVVQIRIIFRDDEGGSPV